jgi:hypothetical protein
VESSPENTPLNKPKLTPEMEAAQWKPGQSGNPGGRPKKKPITEMYERILSDPANLEAIEQAIVKSLLKGNMAMVLQLREVTDRVEGKITQPVEVSGDLGLAERIAKVRADIASGGTGE